MMNLNFYEIRETSSQQQGTQSYTNQVIKYTVDSMSTKTISIAENFFIEEEGTPPLPLQDRVLINISPVVAKKLTESCYASLEEDLSIEAQVHSTDREENYSFLELKNLSRKDLHVLVIDSSDTPHHVTIKPKKYHRWNSPLEGSVSEIFLSFLAKDITSVQQRPRQPREGNQLITWRRITGVAISLLSFLSLLFLFQKIGVASRSFFQDR